LEADWNDHQFIDWLLLPPPSRLLLFLTYTGPKLLRMLWNVLFGAIIFKGART